MGKVIMADEQGQMKLAGDAPTQAGMSTTEPVLEEQMERMWQRAKPHFESLKPGESVEIHLRNFEGMDVAAFCKADGFVFAMVPVDLMDQFNAYIAVRIGELSWAYKHKN